MEYCITYFSRFSHGSGGEGYDHDSDSSSEASEDEDAQERRPVSYRVS